MRLSTYGINFSEDMKRDELQYIITHGHYKKGGVEFDPLSTSSWTGITVLTAA